MNKIVISNQGEIVAEDLMLIGSSTKRDQVGKIGMFGSGWKYALAWFLRNDVEIEIYSGKRRIDVSVEIILHRDKPTKVICVDGVKTSLTTDMGPKWNGWMALREVVSNAIDEGEHSIDTAWSPEVVLKEGITQIIIPTNNELSEVMMGYDKYFSFNRKTNFNYVGGRIFLKSNPSNRNIYRKGIRCYDDHQLESIMDFDFDEIEINESRLANSYDISEAIRNIFTRNNVCLEVFAAVLNNRDVGYLPSIVTPHYLDLLKTLKDSGYNFTCSAVVAVGGMLFAGANAVHVPNSWWKDLESHGLVESLFEAGTGSVKFMRTDAFSTEGIAYFLKSMGIILDLKVGKFESNYTVFVSSGTAMINDKYQGRDKFIAAYIISEMEVEQIEAFLQ